jgi:phosphohistidine phosphatase SixA
MLVFAAAYCHNLLLSSFKLSHKLKLSKPQSMHSRLAKICLVALITFSTADVLAEPTTVIVVRHGERATEPANDPALSAAGMLRADQLAEALAQFKVNAIITTNLRRTKETAQPLAKKMALQAIEVGVRKGEGTAHVPEVIAALSKLSGTVLIVGHSNTTAQIVTALTDEPMMQLCETSFSHVFIVNRATKSVAKLRYGQMDVAASAGCQ